MLKSVVSKNTHKSANIIILLTSNMAKNNRHQIHARRSKLVHPFDNYDATDRQTFVVILTF